MPILKEFIMEVDGYAEIAQNNIKIWATTDLSATYGAIIGVQWALANITQHGGSQVILQIRHHGSNIENWVSVGSTIVFGIGTNATKSIANNPASIGTTVSTVTDTTGYTANGLFTVFLEDNTTFANSKWLIKKNIFNQRINYNVRRIN